MMVVCMLIFFLTVVWGSPIAHNTIIVSKQTTEETWLGANKTCDLNKKTMALVELADIHSEIQDEEDVQFWVAEYDSTEDVCPYVFYSKRMLYLKHDNCEVKRRFICMSTTPTDYSLLIYVGAVVFVVHQIILITICVVKIKTRKNRVKNKGEKDTSPKVTEEKKPKETKEKEPKETKEKKPKEKKEKKPKEKKEKTPKEPKEKKPKEKKEKKSKEKKEKKEKDKSKQSSIEDPVGTEAAGEVAVTSEAVNIGEGEAVITGPGGLTIEAIQGTSGEGQARSDTEPLLEKPPVDNQEEREKEPVSDGITDNVKSTDETPKDESDVVKQTPKVDDSGETATKDSTDDFPEPPDLFGGESLLLDAFGFGQKADDLPNDKEANPSTNVNAESADSLPPVQDIPPEIPETNSPPADSIDMSKEANGNGGIPFADETTVEMGVPDQGVPQMYAYPPNAAEIDTGTAGGSDGSPVKQDEDGDKGAHQGNLAAVLSEIRDRKRSDSDQDAADDNPFSVRSPANSEPDSFDV